MSKAWLDPEFQSGEVDIRSRGRNYRCWAKPLDNPLRRACRIGRHLWALNFYRAPRGPDHFHCFYCGAESDHR